MDNMQRGFGIGQRYGEGHVRKNGDEKFVNSTTDFDVVHVPQCKNIPSCRENPI